MLKVCRRGLEILPLGNAISFACVWQFTNVSFHRYCCWEDADADDFNAAPLSSLYKLRYAGCLSFNAFATSATFVMFGYLLYNSLYSNVLTLSVMRSVLTPQHVYSIDEYSVVFNLT